MRRGIRYRRDKRPGYFAGYKVYNGDTHIGDVFRQGEDGWQAYPPGASLPLALRPGGRTRLFPTRVAAVAALKSGQPATA